MIKEQAVFAVSVSLKWRSEMKLTKRSLLLKVTISADVHFVLTKLVHVLHALHATAGNHNHEALRGFHASLVFPFLPSQKFYT
jgi:hypothetical protein